ncbi:uncharacterized protein LOC131206414 isoform X2 [Anopheles bellator]|uniref:uncharacterized protein LOC131206414 isoform X2 n=1 Tax=Anopheles bellator TaxID=139047 RepID=UPI002648B737|nr:uncharacterized protein LOC131206414 isoform X2 [Anopheles bellator]
MEEPTNDNTTAEELFNSLLGERSREAEKDATEDLTKQVIEANKKDGLAVDEANDTQNDEHQVPIVSTSDEIAEPPRKKQKPSEVNSTGDEVATVLSESLQETRNDREHNSGVAFGSNSCELLSMNGPIKRRRSLVSEIKDGKTDEPNRSSSALNVAEMSTKKPTALEVLVIDDEDEDVSNARPSEAGNDTKKCVLEDSGQRDLHTSGLENTASKSSAKRAKMAECGTLSNGKKSFPGVNPGAKNEEDKEKIRKEPIVLRMDFLRRFARSLTTLTRSDLEVLVMQKVMEAIVYSEEMAELRKETTKQGAMLIAYRQRITDLSKRLSDLMLIQNRVLSELEKRSNRQVLPVKITRNVGIQISVPRHWCSEMEEQPFRSAAGSTPPTTGPKECLPNSPTNVSLTSANGASQTLQTNAVAAVPQTVANSTKHSSTNTARQPQTTSVTRNSVVSSNGALLSNGGTNKQSAMAPSSDHRSTNSPNPKTTESSTSSSITSVTNGNNVARNTSDSNHGGTRKSCHKFTPMRAPMSAQQQAQHLKHAREQQEYMVQQQIKCQQAQRQLQTLDTSKTDQSKSNAARKSTSADSVHIPRPLPSGIRREAGPTSTTSRPTNSSLIDLTDEDDMPRKSTSAARPTLRMNANVPTRSSPNVTTSSTNGQLIRVSEQANQQRSQGMEKHVLNGQIRPNLSQKPTTTSAKSTMVAKGVPLLANDVHYRDIRHRYRCSYRRLIHKHPIQDGGYRPPSQRYE